MKIVTHYSLLHRIANHPEPELPDLNPLIARWHGQRVRRIDRYIQLCLAGALNCVQDRPLPADTGVYIATRSGTVSTAATSMARTETLGLPPKPMHFVNTLGNSAGFYLTQLPGINGGALVVSQEMLSFEAALLHAWLDLTLGRVSNALVGGFDEVVPPTVQHLERLGFAPDCPGLYEGSHWLLLAQPASAGVSLGQPQWFATLDELTHWLSSLAADTQAQTCFAPSEAEQYRLETLGLEVKSYTATGDAPHGTFSGAALTALCAAANTNGHRPLVHIARGDRPPYVAIIVSA